MFSYRLKISQVVVLVILFAGLYLFTVTQHFYIPVAVRPFTLLLAVVLGFIGFFAYVKPAKPYQLSRFLAFWFGTIVAAVIIVLHVIITFDLSWKGFVIEGVTIAAPFIAGAIYNARLKKTA